MFDKLSAAQLVKVFNAVTDRVKPVRKFESHARALALTIAELDRMQVSAPVALARAGLPVPADAPAEDQATRYGKIADGLAADYNAMVDKAAAERAAEAEATVPLNPSVDGLFDAAAAERCQPWGTADEYEAPAPKIGTCLHCGSLLSAVTGECVRGVHCPGELLPAGRTPRMGPKPGRETLKRSERQFVPTATDAVSGAPVELRSLHGPVRTVEGDPEKAAAKIAKDSVKELRQARLERQTAKVAKRARQAATTTEKVLVRTEAWPYAKAAEAPAVPTAPPVKAPAKTDGLTAEQTRLLVALIDCKALAGKPLHERAGEWVKYKAIHDSDTPHNLAKGQLPGLTGALRRRGMIELRGSSANGEVRLTAAALEA
jgi:hypothetical protein